MNPEPVNGYSLFTVFTDDFLISLFTFIKLFAILHSPVYTFFEKAYIIELNADVETGNLKLGNTSTSLYFFQFPISSFKFHCQNTRSTKCKLLLICREGCQLFQRSLCESGGNGRRTGLRIQRAYTYASSTLASRTREFVF